MRSVELRVDSSSLVPPSRQIVLGVLDRIAAGVWKAGHRLPSVRGLAAEALVNPNTVAKAYRDLEGLGAVQGRVGAGVFVTDDGPAIARRERRTATLVALREAVRAALAAGHGLERVRSEVEHLLARAHEADLAARGATR